MGFELLTFLSIESHSNNFPNLFLRKDICSKSSETFRKDNWLNVQEKRNYKTDNFDNFYSFDQQL